MSDTDAEAISEKAEYSPRDERGLEQCPMCGTCLDTRFHSGSVVQPTGRTEATVYDHLLETDPMDGPFYCGECWRSHCTEVAEQTHRTLSEFGTEDRVYYDD